SVAFMAVVGDGIDARRTREGDWHFGSRRGGERIRLDPGGPNRTLKNVLQEKWLSRWQRQNLPCLFHEGRLVWMASVGIDAGYRCPEGGEGLSPRWTMALPESSVVE
ncbi:MAG TPA: tRNA lysidine(34) synthetase TilS, partial [Usitatibacter sp.]